MPSRRLRRLGQLLCAGFGEPSGRRFAVVNLERDAHRPRHSAVEGLAPGVRVLSAREAKGLEFDHVVVAEPAAIVSEVTGVQGLRHLYVALTRATRTLTVVHAQPLPAELR